MVGCFKFVVFFFLGLVYLIFLATNPRAAIFIGVLVIILYILGAKQQKAKAEKDAENRRMREIAARQHKEIEEQRRKELEVQRQRELALARQEELALARQRADLYNYDPSIQAFDQRSTKNIFETPRSWAAAIEARYEAARRHLSDADLVFNDDVEQFNQYRLQLQTELIPRYEAAIRPFFNDLCLRDDDIPMPRELKAAVDFVYPSNLQPAAIHQELAGIAQGLGQGIARGLQGKNLMKLQQQDVMSLAITAAFSGVHYLFTVSQQRTKLEKVQAEVDLRCEEISGAIKTYGRLSEELKLVKSTHESVENYLMRYLDGVIRSSFRGKVLTELQESDQKLVEQCYRGGQALKQILQQDVITPINNRR